MDQALSGVMDTRGITEAEFVIVGVCLATAVMGPEVWSTELLILGRRIPGGPLRYSMDGWRGSQNG